MKNDYLDIIGCVGRLEKLIGDLLNSELERSGISDINETQALLLYNIGNKVLTIGELLTRGYYLGTNISYNLKKLISLGYIVQMSATFDKRSSLVKTTDKGLEIIKKIDSILDLHARILSEEKVDLNKLIRGMNSLASFIPRLFIRDFNKIPSDSAE